MTKSDPAAPAAPTPIERARTIDKLSKIWASVIAQRLSAEKLPTNSTNGVLLSLASELRQIADELLVEPGRPEGLTDDLVLPVIAATVVQLATHMQVISLPDDRQDLH